MCSRRGATPTPLATSRVSTSGVKGRPALGISAEPGLGDVDVLVGRDRVTAPHVAVPDRAPVARQEAVQALGRLDPRDPQADAQATGAGGVGGQQGDVGPVRQTDDVAGVRAQVRPPVAADLHRPQARRQLR